jgi:hypothetical protein
MEDDQAPTGCLEGLWGRKTLKSPQNDARLKQGNGWNQCDREPDGNQARWPIVNWKDWAPLAAEERNGQQGKNDQIQSVLFGRKMKVILVP